jgi:hypothetical protein
MVPQLPCDFGRMTSQRSKASSRRALLAYLSRQVAQAVVVDLEPPVLGGDLLAGHQVGDLTKPLGELLEALGLGDAAAALGHAGDEPPNLLRCRSGRAWL